MFAFQRADFEKVADHPVFLHAVQLMLDDSFNLDPEFAKTWFRGDPKLIEELEKVPRENYGEYLKNYSLPYLSICENPERYRDDPEYGPDHECFQNVSGDLEVRNKICAKATDRYEPAWWAYLHNCENVAAFLMHAFVRILYPHLNVYLYRCMLHTVIIGAPKTMSKAEVIDYYRQNQNPKFWSEYTRDLTKPCIFDVIGFVLNETSEWIFEHWDKQKPDAAFKESLFIDGSQVVEWYIKNYGYHDMDTQMYMRLQEAIDNLHSP